MTAKKEKCYYGVKSVEFLGYSIDKVGFRVVPEKIKAIVDAPPPEDLTQVRAFLGPLNSNFMRNYGKIVNPLYRLLQKNVQWQWGGKKQKAFVSAKHCSVSSEVLVHYDLGLPIKMTCDASPKGLGAVLSHVYPNGVVKPIAFASRSLSKAEKAYSQLNREALGLVFGVEACHQYVYGRSFILETDYRPLTYIFGDERGLPQISASRVQRWAVFLAGYDYEIKHTNVFYVL